MTNEDRSGIGSGKREQAGAGPVHPHPPAPAPALRSPGPNPPHDLDWGTGWVPLPVDNALQAELDRELHRKHPLHDARPVIFGRCSACDDVVAAVSNANDSAPWVVIHLTWSGRAERPKPDGAAWPYFEPVTCDAFVTRFLLGGEHL
jgi:hypothetical protein